MLLGSLFADESRIIYFAPLPMKNEKTNIEEFLPLVDYMQKNLPLTIKFNYHKNYDDILKSFMDGSTDIAYLGPLPYAILKSKYPYAKPIITFNEKDGTTTYRCAISKFSQDVLDLSKPLRVALTQPLSTCGYYATQKLLQKKFGLALKNQKYNYTMSHTNALTGVIREEYMLAGSSEEIAKKYESLGMEIIAKSELFPGFALVVNTKTLSAKEIQEITKTLLNIPKSSYEKWGTLLEYGTRPADTSSYDSLNLKYAIPQKGNI